MAYEPAFFESLSKVAAFVGVYAILFFFIGEFVTFLKDSFVFVKFSFNSWLEDSGLILPYLTN